MEQNQTPDADYQKGFNEGYTIAQHLPELAEQLSKVTGQSLRMSGFQDGHKQFALENEKQRYPSWLTGDYSDRHNESVGKSKDKDKDIEPPER